MSKRASKDVTLTLSVLDTKNLQAFLEQYQPDSTEAKTFKNNVISACDKALQGQVPCPICHGATCLSPKDDPCDRCGGTGTINS